MKKPLTHRERLELIKAHAKNDYEADFAKAMDLKMGAHEPISSKEVNQLHRLAEVVFDRVQRQKQAAKQADPVMGHDVDLEPGPHCLYCGTAWEGTIAELPAHFVEVHPDHEERWGR